MAVCTPHDCVVFRWSVGRWPLNERSKAWLGGACVVFTRAAPPHNRRYSVGRWTDETSSRRCSRVVRINNPNTRTHSLSATLLLGTIFWFSCVTGRAIVCGSVSELHGRDTHDERRRLRTGGSLLSAAEGNSALWILPGGLGVVRLGLQAYRQSWPKRLHSGKVVRNQRDFTYQWFYVNGRGRLVVNPGLFVLFFLATAFQAAMYGDVDRYFICFVICCTKRVGQLDVKPSLRLHSPRVFYASQLVTSCCVLSHHHTTLTTTDSNFGRKGPGNSVPQFSWKREQSSFVYNSWWDLEPRNI